jgi:hypothetical protein
MYENYIDKARSAGHESKPFEDIADADTTVRGAQDALNAA